LPLNSNKYSIFENKKETEPGLLPDADAVCESFPLLLQSCYDGSNDKAGSPEGTAVPILEKDVNLPFPHFTLLKASAGSGKTYALTQRFIQFLLSGKIPRNALRNILAITSSNNASIEMKERVLERLKLIHFDNPEHMGELLQIVSLDIETMRENTGTLIEEILAHYSDFQLRTIDSFMSTVFKASAIDFEHTPTSRSS
jgi:hypothetical protein